jgi:anaerobic magnesium-protoporphyrin IX monomethyl ester cyclase
MKIALIKVQDTTKGVGLISVQYPINISYLAQVCLDLGYQTEIWDFCVEPFNEDYIKEKIRSFKPKIIGLSCVTPAINTGHKIAQWVKEVDESILTLIGGVHVTCMPSKTMEEFPCFDLGVLREAEEILPDIISAHDNGKSLSGIPGTIYRENGGIVHAPPKKLPDVNLIPYPNRELLPADWYSNQHASRGISRKFWNIIEVDSARGCPYPCTFCNVEITHGRSMRFRNPENVHKEIELCVKNLGTNFVIFNDSTFTINKQRAVEIVKDLPGLGIQGYEVNAHVNTVDFNMLDEFAKSGCTKISFGVESGSDRVLRKIGKNSSQKTIRKAFQEARRAKIPIVEATFILGADLQESEEDFDATEKLIKEIQPDIVGVGIITPYPGTPQFEEIKQFCDMGKIPWDAYNIFTDAPPPWRIENFNSLELTQRRNDILKSYYWNPRYILNRIFKIRSFSELFYWAGMAKSFYKLIVKPTTRSQVQKSSGKLA